MEPINLNDRQQIRRYLLGQLAQEEMDAVEARYFAEPAFFDDVDAEAEQLADDATRGLLTPDERSHFDQIRGRPEWKRRLAFVSLLNEAIALPPEGKGALSGWRTALARAAELWRSFGAPMQVASAMTMLLLALGWPLVLVQNARLNSAQEELSAASARSSAAQKSLSDSLVLAEQMRVAVLEREVAAATSTKYLMIPGTTRGVADALYLPRGVTFVDLELATEAPLTYAALRALVRDAAGRVVWRGALTSVAANAPVLRLPTALLVDREYRVLLEGSRDSTSFETVGEYVLTLRRP